MEFNYDVLTSCAKYTSLSDKSASVWMEGFGMKLMVAKLTEYVTAGIIALVM